MSQSCSLQNSWRSMVRDGVIAALLAVAFSLAIRAEFAPAASVHTGRPVAQRARPQLFATP